MGDMEKKKSIRSGKIGVCCPPPARHAGVGGCPIVSYIGCPRARDNWATGGEGQVLARVVHKASDMHMVSPRRGQSHTETAKANTYSENKD